MMPGSSLKDSAERTLFLGYYDIEVIRSAPQVRISSMLNGFKKLGCNNFIVGSAWKRARLQIKWLTRLKSKKLKYAYVENSTSTAWPIDLLFLAVLKMMGIRIGIFIRDVYPAFPYFREKLNWYQTPLYWGWSFSVKVYVWAADIIFVPTKEMVPFIQPTPRNVVPLPPAMQNVSKPSKFDVKSKRFLYLGGISELYGQSVLLRSLELLRKQGKGFGIDFVTREVPKLLAEFEEAEFLSLEYEGIMRLNQKYLAGIIATHEPYSDFAVNVKLFDYFSLGLPVIITQMKGNADIVRKDNLGIIVDPPQDLPEWILKVTEDVQVLIPFQQNCNSKLLLKHSWDTRVKTALEALTGKEL